MNDKMKKTIEPLKNFWQKFSKRAKIIVLSCLGAVIALAIILSSMMNRTQYTMLYSGLGSSEEQAVMDELRTMSVDYRYDNGTIYVDKTKENTARMQLATDGYPKSAPNYDFFTKNVGVMTTDEERKIIERYQLEERLSAVVKSLDPVDNATVTIALPQNSTYAWDDNKEAATASVTVKLRNGQKMDSKQVNGVKQLIATSVPNLKSGNVSVVDSSTGEALSASSEDDSQSLQVSLSEFKLKIEKEYEDNLQKKIISLLTRPYGEGNISVSVKSKMNLDKKIQDIITYSPSTSSNTGVVSHSAETHETTANSEDSGGAAGTQSNADTTETYPGVTVNGNIITAKDSKTYDYLVSKVEQQIQSGAAAVEDVTVSVVVTTDRMTDEQKQELTVLVANAAGIDVGKVAVMTVASAVSSDLTSQPSVPASTGLKLSDLLPWLKDPIVVTIVAAAFAFILGLIILLAVKHSRTKRARRELLLAKLQGDAQPGGALSGTAVPSQEKAPPKEVPPEESIEDLRKVSDSKEEHLKKDLQQFSSQNPEIVAQLLRSLLRGDDRHG